VADTPRGKQNPVAALEEIASALDCELPQGALDGLAQYVSLILRWNRRKRIVGSRDPDEIVGVHLADCLALAGRLQRLAKNGETLLDVGSGAGLPGLAISLLVPELAVSLCEVSEKRVAFLHQARRALNAPFEVLHQDVHRLSEQSLRYDHVVSRAVFEPEQWVVIGRSCVPPSGSVWCMLTERQREQFSLPGDDYRYTVAGDRRRSLLRLSAVATL